MRCCCWAWGATGELQFNKRVHIFNIHLLRRYLSSGTQIWGWRKVDLLKKQDEKKKKNKWEKKRKCCHETGEMLVYGPQHAGCILTGDFAHIIVRVIFHLDFHTSLHHNSPVQPVLLIQFLPKIRQCPILHSFPWLDSEPWCWWGIHPPIFPGISPDVHGSPRCEICQLLAAWLSFSLHQSGHRSALPGPNYGGVTSLFSACWKSHKNYLTSVSPLWLLFFFSAIESSFSFLII